MKIHVGGHGVTITAESPEEITQLEQSLGMEDHTNRSWTNQQETLIVTKSRDGEFTIQAR